MWSEKCAQTNPFKSVSEADVMFSYDPSTGIEQ
jgi:hypothetical protein